MITITFPANNIKEREYTLSVIFEDFLKIPYQLTMGNSSDTQTTIELENRETIIIKDHFFSNFPKELTYLKKENIPRNIEYFSHQLLDKPLPVLFGQPKMDKSTIHIDIFATIFFMLSRWEEYVEKRRDEHGRFIHTNSLAYRFDFLERPIVNEYIEFLWEILKQHGCKEQRKQREFSLLVTHDVDEILRYPNFTKVIKGMLGDIIYRKNPLLPFRTLYTYGAIKSKKIKDPYDTFDEIMDLSDEYNIKSYFFFMSGGTSRYDNRYSIYETKTKEIIDNIKARWHGVGFHPSYNAYNNPQQFKLEKESLEHIYNAPIKYGREHYLRFEVPTTWQIWEDNNLEWCSNLAYAKRDGFRAGCCYPYPVFNILTRKKLNLIERPLIMMEVTFMEQFNDYHKIEKKIEYYMQTIKKYNGEFVLLWHNATFKEHELKKYAPLYKETIVKYKQLAKV